MNYHEIIEKLLPAVKQAGNIIMEYQKKENAADKNIQYKDTINLVTAADQDSEKFIFEEISRIFPHDSILAEEGHEKEGDSGFTWVIDPLDGTTSFAHGFPFFCISLGLIDKNKKPVAGIIYAPMLGETFTAYKDGGAFLNNHPIAVSKVPSLDKALIATGFPYYRRKILGKLTTRLSNFLNVVHDVRRTGSAALDIAYVACGRLDAYYEEGLNPWDIAAAVILLEEAGGQVSKFNGTAIDIFFPEIAASNKMVHKEVIDLLSLA